MKNTISHYMKHNTVYSVLGTPDQHILILFCACAVTYGLRND